MLECLDYAFLYPMWQFVEDWDLILVALFSETKFLKQDDVILEAVAQRTACLLEIFEIPDAIEG